MSDDEEYEAMGGHVSDEEDSDDAIEKLNNLLDPHVEDADDTEIDPSLPFLRVLDDDDGPAEGTSIPFNEYNTMEANATHNQIESMPTAKRATRIRNDIIHDAARHRPVFPKMPKPKEALARKVVKILEIRYHFPKDQLRWQDVEMAESPETEIRMPTEWSMYTRDAMMQRLTTTAHAIGATLEPWSDRVPYHAAVEVAEEKTLGPPLQPLNTGPFYSMSESDRTLDQQFQAGPPSENCHLATLVGAVHSASVTQSKVMPANSEMKNMLAHIAETPELRIPIMPLKSRAALKTGASDIRKHKEYASLHTKYGLMDNVIDQMPAIKAQASRVKAKKRIGPDGQSTRQQIWRVWLGERMHAPFINRPRRVRSVRIPAGAPLPPLVWAAPDPNRYCAYNNELYEPLTWHQSEVEHIPYKAEVFMFPVTSVLIQAPDQTSESTIMRIRLQVSVDPIPFFAVPIVYGTEYCHSTYDEYDVARCPWLRVGQKRSRNELVSQNLNPDMADGLLLLGSSRAIIVNQQQKTDGKNLRRYGRKNNNEIIQSSIRVVPRQRYEITRLLRSSAVSALPGRRRQGFHLVRHTTRASRAKAKIPSVTFQKTKQSIPSSAYDDVKAISKPSKTVKPLDDGATHDEPPTSRKSLDKSSKKSSNKSSKTSSNKPKSKKSSDKSKSSKSSKASSDDDVNPVKSKASLRKKTRKRKHKEDEDDEDENNDDRSNAKDEDEEEEEEEEVDEKKEAVLAEQEVVRQQEHDDEEDLDKIMDEQTLPDEIPVDSVQEDAGGDGGGDGGEEEEGGGGGDARDGGEEEEGGGGGDGDVAADADEVSKIDNLVVDTPATTGGGAKNDVSVASITPFQVLHQVDQYRPLVPPGTPLDQDGAAVVNLYASGNKPIPFNMEAEMGAAAKELRFEEDVYAWNDTRVLASQTELASNRGTAKYTGLEWHGNANRRAQWETKKFADIDKSVASRVAATPAVKQFLYISEWIRWNVSRVFCAFGVTEPEQIRCWLMRGLEKYKNAKAVCNRIIDDMIDHNEGILTRYRALIEIGGVYMSEQKNARQDDDYLANQGVYYLCYRYFKNLTSDPSRDGLEYKLAKFAHEVQTMVLFIAHLVDETDPNSFVYRSIMTYADVLRYNFSHSWGVVYNGIIKSKIQRGAPMVCCPIIPLSHWFKPPIYAMMSRHMGRFQTKRSGVKMASEKTEARQSASTVNHLAVISQLSRDTNRVNHHTGGSARRQDKSRMQGFSSPTEKPTGKNGGLVQQLPITSFPSIELTWAQMERLRDFIEHHPCRLPVVEAWRRAESTTGGGRTLLGPVGRPPRDDAKGGRRPLSDGPQPHLMVRPLPLEDDPNRAWIVSIDEIPIASTRHPERMWRDLWRLKCNADMSQIGLSSEEVRCVLNVSTKGGRPLRPVFIAGMYPPLGMTSIRQPLYVPRRVVQFWNTIQSLERRHDPLVSDLFTTEAGVRMCTYMYQLLLESGCVALVDAEFFQYAYVAETSRDLYCQPLANPKVTSTAQTKPGFPYTHSLVSSTTALRARDLPAGGRAHDICEIHAEAIRSWTDIAMPSMEQTTTSRGTAAGSLIKQAVSAPSADIYVSGVKHTETMYYAERALSWHVVNYRLNPDRSIVQNSYVELHTQGNNTIEDCITKTQTSADLHAFQGESKRTATKSAFATHASAKRHLLKNDREPSTDNIWNRSISTNAFQFPLSKIDQIPEVTVGQYMRARGIIKHRLEKEMALDSRDNLPFVNDQIQTHESYWRGIPWKQSSLARYYRRMMMLHQKHVRKGVTTEFRRTLRDHLSQKYLLSETQQQEVDDENERDNQIIQDAAERANLYGQRAHEIRTEPANEIAIDTDVYNPLESSSSDEECTPSRHPHPVVASLSSSSPLSTPLSFQSEYNALVQTTRQLTLERDTKGEQEERDSIRLTSLEEEEELKRRSDYKYASLPKTDPGIVSSVVVSQSVTPGLIHTAVTVASPRVLDLADKISSEEGQKVVLSAKPLDDEGHTDNHGTPISSTINTHGEPSRQTAGRQHSMATNNLAIQSPGLVLRNTHRDVSHLSGFQNKYTDPKLPDAGHANFDATQDLPQTLAQIEVLSHLGSADLVWKRMAVPSSLATRLCTHLLEHFDEGFVSAATGVMSKVLRTTVQHLDPHLHQCVLDSLSVYDMEVAMSTWIEPWSVEVQRQWDEECDFFTMASQDVSMDFGIQYQALKGDNRVLELAQEEARLELELYHCLQQAGPERLNPTSVRDSWWNLFLVRHFLHVSDTLLLQPSLLESPNLADMNDNELEVYKRQLIRYAKQRLWSNRSGEMVPGVCQTGFLSFIRPIKFSRGYLGQFKMSQEPPRDDITLQPTKSREQNGGITLGYMDWLCMHFNNAQELFSERVGHSDTVIRFICSQCKRFAIEKGGPKPERHCKPCGTGQFVRPCITTAWAQNTQYQYHQMSNLRYRTPVDLDEPVAIPFYLSNRPRTEDPPLSVKSEPSPTIGKTYEPV